LQRRSLADAYAHFVRSTDAALDEWRAAAAELAAADGLTLPGPAAAAPPPPQQEGGGGGWGDKPMAPADAAAPNGGNNNQPALPSTSLPDRPALVARLERAMARCQVARALLAAMFFRVVTPAQLLVMVLESHPAAFRPAPLCAVLLEAERRQRQQRQRQEG
jgi:hypothetical protein